MGMNKYQVIYADPPWHYANRANHKTRFRGGVHGHYQTMSLDAICDLPVIEMVDESAVLYLWITYPHLLDAEKVFRAWGFRYVTVAFDWIKLNPSNYWPFFGVGHYTKSNSEICLFGTRGKIMHPAVNDVSSVIMAPRGRHSQKPSEARIAIERMYPEHRKLELFAREKVAGWDSWGNEVESDIEIAV